jgi:hypothetical protein
VYYFGIRFYSEADDTMLCFQCFVHAEPSSYHKKSFKVKLNCPQHLVLGVQRFHLCLFQTWKPNKDCEDRDFISDSSEDLAEFMLNYLPSVGRGRMTSSQTGKY